MKFYTLEDAPVYRDDQVFKASTIGPAIGCVVMYGLAITALILAVGGGKPLGMSPGILYFFAVVIGLFGLIPLALFRASLRPSNWLLRCSSSGIIIKYRPYENWRLPSGDVQVVGLEYSEIAWAKLVKERRTAPSGDGHNAGTISFITYIDFGLADPDTSALERNLQNERNIRPDGKVIFMDYVVQVLPGGIVEIRWNGINPPARKAIASLSSRLQVKEVEHRKTDLTHHCNSNASPEEENAKILALAKGGDEIEAANLARRVYGYSLTDATNFVDKLMGRQEE